MDNQIPEIEMKAVLKVRDLLDGAEVEYDYREHEPTPTSQDSSRVRGTKMSEGIKALIARGKKTGENYMFCLPSDLMVSRKLAKAIVGEAFDFEKPEVLKEKYGLIIGGVPPFGFLFGIETYYSDKITDEERAAFNCGSPRASVAMDSRDFLRAVKAEEELVSITD